METQKKMSKQKKPSTHTKTPLGLSAFEKYLVEEDRAPLTVRGYLRDLALFAEWFKQTNGAALAPKLLTAQDVRDYRQHLLRHKAAAATVNRKLMAISAYARWARSAKLIEFDPTEKVKMIDQETAPPKWLDRQEQGALLREAQRALNAAKSEVKKVQAVRDLAVIQALLHTGLRVSELCALEMSDLTISERKGKLRVRLGKGAKQRDVPLNATALAALKEWLGVRPQQADHEFVFTGKGSLPLGSSGVQEILAEIGRRAGVEVTPHRLRHTFAKNLVDRGVPIDQVGALAGHSSLNTTRRYTTPSASDLEKAVGMVGD